ncbi:MAG: endo-1,4-beta-xylanase, partial [Clostridiales bacterium]|nr:endo-1,4-beta-xylanase [Clostridiales bacterium]
MGKQLGKTWDLTLPSLCKKFERYFKIGNIIWPQDFDDPDLIKMFKHHYNSVTAENAMKPMHISFGPGAYKFDDADKIVD